jgi:hypothetical protein
MLWIIAGAIFALGALVAGTLVWTAWSHDRAIAAAREEVRAAGYPATLEELNRWYAVPGGVEPPPDLLKLLMEGEGIIRLGRPEFPQVPWKSHEDYFFTCGGFSLPRNGAPLSDETRRLLADYMAAKKDVLDVLHKAAGLGPFRFPVEFKIAYQVDGGAAWLDMPYWDGVDAAAELLGLEAVHHAEEGRPRDAARAVRSFMGLARSLEHVPHSATQSLLRARTLYDEMTVVLARILMIGGLPDADLAALGEDMRLADSAEGLVNALVGARAFELEVFDTPAMYHRLDANNEETLVDRAPGKVALVAYRTSGRLKSDLREYLDIVDEALLAAKSRAPGRSKALADAADRAMKARDKSLMRHILSRNALFIIEMAVQKHRVVGAYLGCSRAAVAIERFRLAKGSLPAKLDELVPEFLDSVPLDPFDGKPLRYSAIDEKSYKVWSIGWDGTDGGGDERNDITFAVER